MHIFDKKDGIFFTSDDRLNPGHIERLWKVGHGLVIIDVIIICKSIKFSTYIRLNELKDRSNYWFIMYLYCINNTTCKYWIRILSSKYEIQ
jgi:hypothetical protein